MNRSLYEQAPFRSATGAEFRPGGLALTEELAAECGLKPGQRLLDLGCGVGSTASYLTGQWGVIAVGLDSSARFIEEAKTRDPGVTWVMGRAQEIPYGEGFFDAVFCECFLTLVDDPGRVLAEIRRVLRADGRLAITDLYLRDAGHGSSLSSLPAATCLRGATGREAVVSMLELAGFTVSVWRDHSDALKAFMGRMVFAYGSGTRFWEAILGEDEAGRASIVLARPGYYMLVGQPLADPRST